LAYLIIFSSQFNQKMHVFNEYAEITDCQFQN